LGAVLGTLRSTGKFTASSRVASSLNEYFTSQNISITNTFCSFKLSFHQRIFEQQIRM